MENFPAAWPELYKLFSVVDSYYDRDDQLNDLLQSLSGEDLMEEILAPSSNAGPRSVASSGRACIDTASVVFAWMAMAPFWDWICRLEYRGYNVKDRTKKKHRRQCNAKAMVTHAR